MHRPVSGARLYAATRAAQSSHRQYGIHCAYHTSGIEKSFESVMSLAIAFEVIPIGALVMLNDLATVTADFHSYSHACAFAMSIEEHW
jgi:hypothetical protein